jgi:hypothetical protein
MAETNHGKGGRGLWVTPVPKAEPGGMILLTTASGVGPWDFGAKHKANPSIEILNGVGRPLEFRKSALFQTSQ